MFSKLKRWFQKHTQPQIIAGGPKRKGTIEIPPFIDPYIASDINKKKRKFVVTDHKGDPPIIFKTHRYPELNPSIYKRGENRKDLIIFDPDPSNSLINSVIENSKKGH